MQIIANRYRIEDELGRGGIGVVYRATDLETDQSVAVKSLRQEQLDATPSLLERFRREGEALRDLNHPNIVKMLDMVEVEGGYYLIEELINSGDLKDLLAEGEMPIKQITSICLELADALTRAHHLNIIHRDLKPANVLIAEDGTARLTDFGVALIGDKQRVTDKGVPVGTIEYLSPEALTGEVDTRSDIWAFGVMMFEMLAGKRPFRGRSISDVVSAIMMEDVPDLEVLRPDAPMGLIDLIYRMLEKDRNARIPSIRLVGAELEALMMGERLDTTSIPVALGGVAGLSRFDSEPNLEVLTRHNLPAQMTSFIGREYEIEELKRLVQDPNVRLITLLGPGGIGKTRLALEVATGLVEDYKNRVFLVNLAPLTDAALIVQAIAESMHFRFLQDERTQKQQLIDYIGQKKTLLLFDNYEHLLEGAALVSDILQSASNTTIIATSRQRLNQSGEAVFILEGMDFPEDSSLSDAMDYSAVKLFVQSARRVSPSFELAENDIPHVAKICQQVQGLPLGILLAASWAGMLSPQEITDEIRSSIDFLSTDMGGVVERHRSIRAVFDYSWHLLTETEQEIFMKLAVFRGGFTRDAATKVVGASLRMLMSLINKSLLRRDPDSGRYAIHELLREYAKERLAVSVIEADLRKSHMQFFIEFAYEEGQKLFGGQQLRAMETLDEDFDNIRAAWQYAIHIKEEPALSRMGNFWIYYDVYGIWDEAIENCERSLKVIADPNGEVAADVLVMAGISAYRKGDLDAAWDYTKRAVDIYAALNIDYKLLGEINLTNIMMERGELATAEAKFFELAGRCHRLGHYWAEAICYLNLGLACVMANRIVEAEAYTRMALDLRRKGNDLLTSSTALHNLGDISYRRGHFDKAKELLMESLTIALMFDSRVLIYTNMIYLSKVHLEMGNLAEAADYAHRAVSLAEEGAVQMQLHLGQVALLASLEGRDTLARRYVKRLLEHPKIESIINYMPEVLEAVPRYLKKMGHNEEASQWITHLLTEKISEPAVRKRLLEMQSELGERPQTGNIGSVIKTAITLLGE